MVNLKFQPETKIQTIDFMVHMLNIQNLVKLVIIVKLFLDI